MVRNFTITSKMRKQCHKITIYSVCGISKEIIMKKLFFLKSLVGLMLFLTFFKIYLHNQVIHIGYRLQKLQYKHEQMSKKRDRLAIELAQLKSYKKVKEWALDDRKMKVLSMVLSGTMF